MPDWKRFWRGTVATLSRDVVRVPPRIRPSAAAEPEALRRKRRRDSAAAGRPDGVPAADSAGAARDPARGRGARPAGAAARNRDLARWRAVDAHAPRGGDPRSLGPGPLTGLASARRFADRLTVAIVHARRHRQKLAVVQLGLDKFASVNERLGRSHGDDLLRSVALALESTLRQGDTLARAAGDVFTILLPGIKRDEDVTVIADKLRLALRSPFSIGGHDLLLTASLGWRCSLTTDRTRSRCFERHGVDEAGEGEGRRLLGRARAALAGARRRAPGDREPAAAGPRPGRARALLAAGGRVRDRHDRERRVAVALAARPGVEKAADFVSLADIAGLAVPLGQWTLRAACLQGRKWHDAGHVGLAVSVNISQRQLQHAALVKLVRRVLDETGLPPACLELEVRESELVRNPDLAIERLTELRKLGLRIALDDFGTGESRLSHLYRYPLDSIKIDGSMVSGAPANHDHEAVISAAIALARSRRLKVVAEGVETEAQRVHLVRWQCDRMQGNLCGPPATAAETERLLLRQRQARELAPDAAPGRRLL